MSSDNSYFLNSATQNAPNAPTPGTPGTGGQVQSGLYNACTSIAFMDELIKEYLLFRGFNATIKAFEHDLKLDKDRSFRADKITDQLFAYIHAYDLNGLLEYWSYLDHKYFSKITLRPSAYSSAVLSRKYELFLLRYYLINAIQTSRTEKAVELFENYASKLQSQSEWKEWYCLPFLKNPEENLVFSVYFNKNWKDAFIVSLQNFLNIVFQSVNFPRLINYDEDAFWNKQIYQRTISSNITFTSGYLNFEQEYLQHELVDEFQQLQSDHHSRHSHNSFMSLIKNFAAYPSRSASSTTVSSKSAANAHQSSNILMNTNSSNLMAAEALNQNVARIMALKSSAFDHMVKNRTMSSQNRPMAQQATTVSERVVITQAINESSKDSLKVDLQMSKQLSAETTSSSSSFASTTVSGGVDLQQQLVSSNRNRIVEVDETKCELQSEELTGRDKATKEEKVVSSNVEGVHTVENKIAEPYLTLNHEDYTEHKSAILQCKFSKDGKYVASLDSSSLIKIWSIENALNTVSTIMQKSFILTIEWDKRFNNLLYIGMKSNSIKLYDVYQKRIIQDLAFNKLYPLVTLINSFLTNEKVLIFMASKQQQTTPKLTGQREQRSGQMAVCSLNNTNFNLTIEKLVDLDGFFCQSAVNFVAHPAATLMGCSDGSIRMYDSRRHEFTLHERHVHTSNILNLVLNKNDTALFSLSTESLKLWTLISDSVYLSGQKNIRLSIVNEIKLNSVIHQLAVPFNSYEQLISSTSFVDLANLVDLKLSNPASVIKLDSTESFMYILDRNGVLLRDVGGSNESAEANTILGSKFRKLFNLEGQATSIEVWNASHLCILIVGGQNGVIRIYKLLHQF